MQKILLAGAGKIGAMIAELLAQTGDYQVVVADIDEAGLQAMPKHPNITTVTLDLRDEAILVTALQDKFAVLSACPFQITQYVAKAARAANVHYFDLTEDVECTRLVKQLAADARTAFIPQCGLAPGFISIVAHNLTLDFDELHNVHMRVGALPKYPANALNYNLTWSTDGLINEYCNPCEAIVDGQLREVAPLEGMEEFSLDGITYEAFNTSGGLGTLCETLKGKVDNLNYRTVRYPGHRQIMKVLLQDLRLGERRELLKDIFEYAIPVTAQDVVLVFVSVSGTIAGQLVQKTYANKIYSKDLNGKTYSAIQWTTASGICTMLDLLIENKLPQRGFVRQEQASLKDFLGNRFGKNYQSDPASALQSIDSVNRKVA